jgi:ribose 5-phosphate isomerase B
MRISIGADHAGLGLKEHLREKLVRDGHDVVDHGTNSGAASDYPDFAAPVARDVAAGRAERGVLVCSTGIGMSISANKVRGVRAALGTSVEEVGLVRGHNDANIITFGAKYTQPEAADAMLDVFLSTGFEGGRHARRIGKIAALEQAEDREGEQQETRA